VLDNTTARVGDVTPLDNYKESLALFLVAINLIHARGIALIIDWWLAEPLGKTQKSLEGSLRKYLTNMLPYKQFLSHSRIPPVVCNAASNITYKLRMRIVRMTVYHFFLWKDLLKRGSEKAKLAHLLSWHLDCIPIEPSMWNQSRQQSQPGGVIVTDINTYHQLFSPQAFVDSNITYYTPSPKPTHFGFTQEHNTEVHSLRERLIKEGKGVPFRRTTVPEEVEPKTEKLPDISLGSGVSYFYLLPDNKYALQICDKEPSKPVVSPSLMARWSLLPEAASGQIHTQHLSNYTQY
jgi:hypothetical protein